MHLTPRLLPLFPLPLVLFPGVPLPLHIFEPRYRAMLDDCLGDDERFGILYCPSGVDEHSLTAGHVGCVAHIESAQRLPDGRSNIVVRGEDRFALVRYVEAPTPYHVGSVTTYEDQPEPAPLLDELAGRVREVFARVGSAARTIADDPDPPPEPGDDPSLLAFGIASMIDLDGDARQRLLASRSAGQRLRDIESVLAQAVEALESRAATHTRAKSNGAGPFHS